MSSPKRPPLPAITGIRIFLAVWVLVLHMATFSLVFGEWLGRRPVWMQSVVESGASAVGIFFLLSGFVLAYNYDLSRPWHAAERNRFWLARIARVYPVYALALVVGIPSLVASVWKGGAIHPASLLGGIGAVLLLVQSWIPQDALFWGGPAWSLSAEAFFYLMFPFAGRLLWKIEGRRPQLAALASLWVATCTVAYLIALRKAPFLLAHNASTDTAWSEVIKFNPLVRLPEFLAGIVLCKLYLSIAQRSSGWAGAGRGYWLYLAGFGAALAITAEQRHIPPAVLHDGLLLPATCAAIIGLCLGGGWLWRMLSTRSIVVLGQASYSLYLLHMPLYSYFGAAGKRVSHHPWQAWGLLGVYVLALVALSCITFFRLEEPMRRVILARFSGAERRPKRVTVLQPVDADPM